MVVDFDALSLYNFLEVHVGVFFFNWAAYRGWPDAQCAIHCITTPIAYDPEAFILKIRSSGGVASWHWAHSHRLAPDCRHYTVGVPKLRNTSLKQSLFSNLKKGVGLLTQIFKKILTAHFSVSCVQGVIFTMIAWENQALMKMLSVQHTIKEHIYVWHIH